MSLKPAEFVDNVAVPVYLLLIAASVTPKTWWVSFYQDNNYKIVVKSGILKGAYSRNAFIINMSPYRPTGAPAPAKPRHFRPTPAPAPAPGFGGRIWPGPGLKIILFYRADSYIKWKPLMSTLRICKLFGWGYKISQVMTGWLFLLFFVSAKFKILRISNYQFN